MCEQNPGTEVRFLGWSRSTNDKENVNVISEDDLAELFIFDGVDGNIRSVTCQKDECDWSMSVEPAVVPRDKFNEACTEHYRSEHGGPPLAILNMSTVTADGRYSIETISKELASTILMTRVDIESYVGHADTASILTDMLGVEVEYKPRRMLEQQPGQWVLVAKLNDRPQHGRRLSREELEEIGFTFKLMIRTA